MTKTDALRLLGCWRGVLTKQQIKTLRGQILHGDVEGAMRGLSAILQKKEDNNA